MNPAPASSGAPKLLVIGGGNMGSAIVLGAFRAGILPAANVLIAEPDAAKHGVFGSQHIACVATAQEGLAWANANDSLILLAVKPQILPQVVAECGTQFAHSPKTVISILAGTRVSTLAVMLGAEHRIIRAMPNLPASIGAGTTAVCFPAGPSHAGDAFVHALLSAIGPTVLAIPEPLFDAFTAVAGSGPAYFFYLAECMQRSAVAQGFEPATAAIMIRTTLLGSAQLLAHSQVDAATLRSQVTSKGGTTQAALTVFDGLGVADSIEAGIAAAVARSRELGK